MPEESGGEKSLPASPHKKQKARQEGNIAKSQDLNAAWTMLVALLVFTLMGGRMLAQMVDATRHYLSAVAWLRIDMNTLQQVALEVVARMGRLMLPFLIIMAIAGLIINIVQVGILFTLEPLKPKPQKLNIFTGWKKFFNARSGVELLKSVAKLGIIGYIVLLSLRGRWEQVLALPYLTPLWATKAVAGIVCAVWLRVVLVMIVLGILDYAFQWWMREQELRMTVQEAREETKHLEGDPRIKRRIREIQRQMAYQRMMGEVPTADVIVTNPTRYAVALRYNMATMNAPVLVAKGTRLLAERIREIAEEHDVPIVEKPELARTLYRTIDVGGVVPEKLFRAVAEVLAFVYQIDRRADKARERQWRPSPATQPAG
ncbi:MAG: flagellar biosynthesis protein FlhB [Candidatus Hydrogenedentes bacterium]|nr:flagellar biosynthesis protein FlhB [Candidatus Hydrogenedentota bacterium]